MPQLEPLYLAAPGTQIYDQEVRDEDPHQPVDILRTMIKPYDSLHYLELKTPCKKM